MEESECQLTCECSERGTPQCGDWLGNDGAAGRQTQSIRRQRSCFRENSANSEAGCPPTPTKTHSCGGEDCVCQQHALNAVSDDAVTLRRRDFCDFLWELTAGAADCMEYLQTDCEWTV